MKEAPQGIAASALSGVRWSYLGGVGSMLCSMIVGIVLARILGPKPYGQVILANTVNGFVNLFADGGLSQALIQKRTLETAEIRTTFTWQLAAGLTATFAVYLSAPWIARWSHDLSATRVIEAMSWMIAIQSSGLVAAALLRRSMRFRTVQSVRLTSYAIAFIGVGVPLAILGAGVWSLVAAALCQCLLNAICLYAANRHPLAPHFGLLDRSMTIYGGATVANNMVNWGHANLGNLAASQLGPVALGFYGRACSFAYHPMNLVVSGLQSVLTSSTARVQDRERTIEELTVCVLAIVFGVLGCAYAVCAFIPETTIVGLFGEKWRQLVPLTLPLAIAMPFYGVHCILGPILCGLGKPQLELWPQAISCGVASAVLFTAAHVSLVAIAWAWCGVTILRSVLVASFTFRTLRVSWGRMLRILANRSCVAVAFGGLIWAADQMLRALLHLPAGERLIILIAMSLAIAGWMIWSAGEAVFGRDAIRFLLRYAELLPASYVRRLHIQAYRHDFLGVWARLRGWT